MQGSYVGEDAAGTESQNDIGIAKLKSAQWMNIVRLSNKLIAKANVNVAEWLMALVAEGLAYRLDREGFVGGTYAGSPFVGLLASNDVTTQTLASTLTGFEDVTIAEASEAIGAIPTAALQDAAFYFHRTVWAQLRPQKDATSGQFAFNHQNMMLSLRKESGIQPVGEILGYPVYTTDVLPAYSTSAVSTKFGVFGNLKLALAMGEDGPMSMARSESAVINSVSTFERNQTAMRFTHDHALAIALPAAAVVLKTAAS
jgi:HK97 family phage major capsid protein